ncbi:bifunctional adenosylcobinamide kinase/adenosylcobinamide-phosphate guanylyltransferase [Tenacibaculum sp. SG-28]|uniref:bifunctional adenosylcobinamide kinase/adenosylcobinamide-phosphate guanylyltransferase n=1 Tax=Tenacibaculum sp. SG-28 TaxID=754426 RepID=UPI000CF3771B|nr:bifunctional adenosylcobinamide kinase/adenosylcobinamide-phosphate guanylyltransferase [Tenacibaculum sp. SG-28]PQJ22783.1 adenosylcobinamide kinase/adenosylcobinamide phosphate guanyltransferase [Tenacibaculum sp. SG-28]
MLYFITGGERSGKSTYGEKLALSLSKSPVYLATSRIWDANFKQRIEYHRNTRSEAFINREEEKNLATAIFEDEVVLIDCVTLWLTNYFSDLNSNLEACLALAKAEIDKVVSINATVIFISNEIGMGMHASTPEGRKFTELQGWVNQYIAEKATKATVLISGLPLHLK